MAYTRIHPIKATIARAIKYITNPEKTDDMLLVSSFACAPETAAADFKFTLSHTNKNDPNKAYHLIQSFAPGEVNPEEAHAIGKEFARRLLGDNYSYVISTHIDKNHCHNHIIFCAANNVDYRKYHDCKKSYYKLCQISNDICKEHNLSVIGEHKNIAKDYLEWKAEHEGNSWKSQLKSDISSCINKAHSYKEFLSLMTSKGYEIKGTEPSEESEKYIMFKVPGKTRFVRGKASTLGTEYTRERIIYRIENKAKIRTERMSKPLVQSTLIDTNSNIKFKNSPALKHWADTENLKRASSIFAEINRLGFNSIESLNEHLNSLKETAETRHDNILDIERKMHSLADIIYFAERYSENKKFNIRYEKSKDPERYYQNHKSQLTLYGGAVEMLKRFDIDPSEINLEELKESYENMKAEHSRLITENDESLKEQTQLEKLKKSLEEYTEMDKQHSQVKSQEIHI